MVKDALNVKNAVVMAKWSLTGSAKMDTGEESALYPIILRAYTLSWYMVSVETPVLVKDVAVTPKASSVKLLVPWSQKTL